MMNEALQPDQKSPGATVGTEKKPMATGVYQNFFTGKVVRLEERAYCHPGIHFNKGDTHALITKVTETNILALSGLMEEFEVVLGGWKYLGNV